jgi:hypothetical protein
MDPSVFKGMRLCISTPMYRSEVCDAFLDSRRELDGYLDGAGIPRCYAKVKDTYLPRARNVLADAFMATDATHQLLFDSDMGFNAGDVMRMLYHCAVNPKMWVMGAAYPQRCADWQRAIDAVKNNPNITPEQLEVVLAGNWTFGGLPGGNYDLGAPVHLSASNTPHVATGIMVIAREAYEKLKPVTPSYIDARQGNKRVYRFFHCDIEPETEWWLGEDVWFCRELKKAGIKMYLAPWVRSEHWGPFAFKGDLSKVVDAGAEI